MLESVGNMVCVLCLFLFASFALGLQMLGVIGRRVSGAQLDWGMYTCSATLEHS